MMEFVSWDDEIPNIWENKTCSKPCQTINQGLYSPSNLRVTSKMASPSDSKAEVTGWTEHDLHLRVIAIDVMSDQQQKVGDQPYQPYLTMNIN